MRTDTIVKLGGSLFEWSLFAETWIEWRRSRPPEEVLWVVPGGGGIADYVRHLQKIQKFSDSIAHYMALNSMEVHNPWLHDIFEISKYGRRWVTNLLDVNRQLKKIDLAKGIIPENWGVTSDALTLRLAVEGFRKVLFVKSVGPKHGHSLDEAIANAWVDDWTIANGKELLTRYPTEFEWVNLRSWAKAPQPS